MLTAGIGEEGERERTRHQAGEQAVGLTGDAQAAQHDGDDESDHHRRAEHAELLREHGEDEVGVAFGQEVEVALRAVASSPCR
jgi:hypothetical protein